MSLSELGERTGGLTAQQEAYLYLQDQIVSGALPGGTPIISEHVAKALQISRMPVREAIRQLHAEGFITIRPNRSAIVTPRSPEQLVELIEMRAALEGLAIRLAVPNVTNQVIGELRFKASGLRGSSFNHLELVQRHDDFHDYLCSICMRPRLAHELRQIRLAERPYIRKYTKSHSSIERPGYEHDLLIDALEKRDPDHAERLLREHIMINGYGISSKYYSCTEK